MMVLRICLSIVYLASLEVTIPYPNFELLKIRIVIDFELLKYTFSFTCCWWTLIQFQRKSNPLEGTTEALMDFMQIADVLVFGGLSCDAVTFSRRVRGQDVK